MGSNPYTLNCSYPTYEEWKHGTVEQGYLNKIWGSYPTYEEWKHRNKIELRCIKKVLILPMRNGNAYFSDDVVWTTKSSYPTYEEWKRPISPKFEIFIYFRFLSYL